MLYVYLLIITIIAGVSYGQDYTECEGSATLIQKCQNDHLQYLKKLSSTAFKLMSEVAELGDPLFLLKDHLLHSICNDTVHLKAHYSCVFSNLTDCLQKVNSTQVDSMPSADRISMGIFDLCKAHDELNITCITMLEAGIDRCITKTEEEEEPLDACMTHNIIYECTDVISECAGSDLVKNFLASSRPHDCAMLGSATQRVATLAVFFVAILLNLLLSP